VLRAVRRQSSATLKRIVLRRAGPWRQQIRIVLRRGHVLLHGPHRLRRLVVLLRSGPEVLPGVNVWYYCCAADEECDMAAYSCRKITTAPETPEPAATRKPHPPHPTHP
jgi:hypothetical protein